MPTLTRRSEVIEEIIDGVVRELPPPSPEHARLIEVLAEVLQRQLDFKKYLVRTTPFGLGISRGSKNYRVPDLAVFDRTELAEAPPEGKLILVRPLLIAEVLSPLDRKGSIDQLIQDYRTASVGELWLIRPEDRLVEDAAGQQVSAGTISALHLPGTTVDVELLWKAFAS
jgi:Uma2 family endonuclease